MTTPRVHAQFDDATNTVSYVVWDPSTCRAAIIDPVLDYDHRSGRASHRSADTLLGVVDDHGLTVDWILETHAHADHLSAAPYLKEKTGAPIGIGERITEVQRTFAPVFGLDDVSGDGREFGRVLLQQVGQPEQVAGARGGGNRRPLAQGLLRLRYGLVDLSGARRRDFHQQRPIGGIADPQRRVPAALLPSLADQQAFRPAEEVGDLGREGRGKRFVRIHCGAFLRRGKRDLRDGRAFGALRSRAFSSALSCRARRSTPSSA